MVVAGKTVLINPPSFMRIMWLSMSLTCEPASEPLPISVKQVFLCETLRLMAGKTVLINTPDDLGGALPFAGNEFHYTNASY